jgi:hypothetical protein
VGERERGKGGGREECGVCVCVCVYVYIPRSYSSVCHEKKYLSHNTSLFVEVTGERKEGALNRW